MKTFGLCLARCKKASCFLEMNAIMECNRFWIYGKKVPLYLYCLEKKDGIFCIF